jgi:hypothetical protein
VALHGKGFSTNDIATVNAAKAAGKALTAGGGDTTKYTKSADVFGALQDARASGKETHGNLAAAKETHGNLAAAKAAAAVAQLDATRKKNHKL